MTHFLVGTKPLGLMPYWIVSLYPSVRALSSTARVGLLHCLARLALAPRGNYDIPTSRLTARSSSELPRHLYIDPLYLAIFNEMLFDVSITQLPPRGGHQNGSLPALGFEPRTSR